MTRNLGGIAGWLLQRACGGKAPERRLTLVDRIALGPRQSLVLVEAEGQRILVAASGEGGVVFYPLDGSSHRGEGETAKAKNAAHAMTEAVQ